MMSTRLGRRRSYRGADDLSLVWTIAAIGAVGSVCARFWSYFGKVL